MTRHAAEVAEFDLGNMHGQKAADRLIYAGVSPRHLSELVQGFSYADGSHFYRGFVAGFRGSSAAAYLAGAGLPMPVASFVHQTTPANGDSS